ncbi:MAG: hypothetical protein DRH30_13715 [Deltaproteobacteria bacterium]|nr:MAG: hypothetical protein DRH30_13715 [Deltaproteobacteria bacterium]
MFCATSALEAQEIDNSHLFPGVARLPGQPPSQWVSDVTVNNLHGFEIEIGFMFFAERTEHGIDDFVFPPEHRFQLAPRETRLFEDVLATVFGLDNAKGALLVTCSREMLEPDPPPGEDDLYILATMRTYDVSSPLGTYGQTIPANNFIINSSGEQSFITGALNSGLFRSNLGIINLSLDEVTFHYRIMKPVSTIVAQGTKTLASLWVQQWSFNSLGVGTVNGPLTVDLWIDPDDVKPRCLDTFDGGAGFLAYVSKVDSRTQDAEFMYAAPAFVAERECD